jgi:hypothetical protein
VPCGRCPLWSTREYPAYSTPWQVLESWHLGLKVLFASVLVAWINTAHKAVWMLAENPNQVSEYSGVLQSTQAYFRVLGRSPQYPLVLGRTSERSRDWTGCSMAFQPNGLWRRYGVLAHVGPCGDTLPFSGDLKPCLGFRRKPLRPKPPY